LAKAAFGKGSNPRTCTQRLRCSKWPKISGRAGCSGPIQMTQIYEGTNQINRFEIMEAVSAERA
jgi:hypothetical protein